MTKQKLVLNTPKAAALAVLAVVLLGLGFAAFKSKTTPKAQPTPTPTPSVSEGVYTDIENGFMLEFPSDIFKYASASKSKFYERQINSEDGEYGAGLILTISVYDQNSFIERFNNEESLKLNEALYSNTYLASLNPNDRPYDNKIKVKNIPNGHIIYHFYSGLGNGIEPFYAYEASWKKTDKVISVMINNIDDKRKAEQLDLILKIADSFKFLN